MERIPSNTGNTVSPLLQFLGELGSIINHYHVQSAKLYPHLYKIILTDLILNHTSLSAVEIEAKELEAEMYIERLEDLLVKWKTDKDRLPLNVLTSIALAGGGTETFVQQWAPKQLQEVESQYTFVEHAVDNMKKALAAGRLGWSAVKQQLFNKNGAAIMEAAGRDASRVAAES